MKLKELNIKKLGLNLKRKDYVFRYWKESKYKGLSEKTAIEMFIKRCNEKGHVPFNIESETERERFVGDSIEKVRYGIVWAACCYFGKRNAAKIKSLEDKTLLKNIKLK